MFGIRRYWAGTAILAVVCGLSAGITAASCVKTASQSRTACSMSGYNGIGTCSDVATTDGTCTSVSFPNSGLTGATNYTQVCVYQPMVPDLVNGGCMASGAPVTFTARCTEASGSACGGGGGGQQ